MVIDIIIVINNKLQIPNNKQFPMTKITNSKQKMHHYSTYLVSVIEISDLEFICNLVLVYWDFSEKYQKRFIECQN